MNGGMIRQETSLSVQEVLESASIIIIQFNSILYYLCAEPTAVRPITDTAQCTYK
jgi:hypothetical protein